MFRRLHSIILSISIRFNSKYPILAILASIGLFNPISSAAQTDWVLSGTTLIDTQAQAMFINEEGIELLVDKGELIQGCQLIDVQTKSAKLRCGDELHILPLRNSVGDLTYKASQLNGEVMRQMITLPRDEIKDYVKQRQRMVSEIGFLPLVEDEKVIGFSVSKLQPNSAASELGLFNGDIITSINGVSASDTSQFLHTVSELISAPQVSIEVERFGQQHAYTYILE